ncbi:hypothetical protein PGB90_006523 [Kerria lacca]
MDVLNFKKQPSSSPQTKHFRTETVVSYEEDVIKIEPDEEQEKENCEDVSDSSDFVIDNNHRNIAEDLNLIKDELSEEEETELGEVDIDPDLPNISVVLKEQDNVIEHSPKYDDVVSVPKPRNEVEIKYEDDIEEEEYDSDEESVSVDTADMPELTSFHDEKSNSMSSGSSFNKTTFDMNQTERMSVDQEKSIDKASDSVLLSIVYATINVPFSQVSKFLAAYNLSKSQLSVIRKVRRQVKNRLYAQNCRRRRVAHIRNLANELKQIKTEKEKLISQRADLTAKKISLHCRYKQLYNYVIHELKERYENYDFQQIDSMNLTDNSQIHIQKRKSSDERELMEIKKRKSETHNEDFHKHVLEVITAHNHNNGMSKNSIDFKLCNMNIVNELAMLNKYWTKNNSSANELIDVDSSTSVDGSRTSENKLNDFVDYESSTSVDDSPSGENGLNDFIDYESSMDESIINEQVDGKSEVNLIVDNNGEIENLEIDEENYRISDISTMAWPENSDEEMDTSDEIDLEFDELEEEQEELKDKKKALEKKYEMLYNIVLQALEVNETDFLKMYMDYCLKLLKIPGRDLYSIAFNGR